ncbi:hypothetical protein ZWY2020_026393 [Hordeum vulgare]|nr:hypothetical protein ZWY2020_026393 [Hordeum vulgare]
MSADPSLRPDAGGLRPRSVVHPSPRATAAPMRSALQTPLPKRSVSPSTLIGGLLPHPVTVTDAGRPSARRQRHKGGLRSGPTAEHPTQHLADQQQSKAEQQSTQRDQPPNRRSNANDMDLLRAAPKS